MTLIFRKVLGLAAAVPLTVFALLLAAPNRAHAAPEVFGARLGEHDGRTRFVLDLTESVQFKLWTLGDPYRVVLELPGASFILPPKDTPQRGQGLIAAFRFGFLRPGEPGMVLDLAKPAAIAGAFILAPSQRVAHWRLVIDLRPTDSAAFLANVARASGVPNTEKATKPEPVKPAAKDKPVRTPAKAEPAKAEPATKPAKAEPAPEPAKAESAPEPAKADPAPEPAKADPALETAKAESVPEPTKVAPVKVSTPSPPPSRKASKPQMTAALAVPPPIPQTPPTDRRYTIVLDPGHGGIDPGATGPQGIVEKDITLTLAMELKRQLEKIERYRVVLTRERDVSMALAERVQVARNNSADLFISLHADSNHDARVRGATFYTLSGTASDAAAAEYAAKENRADIIAGFDLRNESEEVTTILIDLAQRETMSDSVRFARAALKSFTGRVSLAPKSHRFAGFKVLKAPDVPSVLIEFAYLTNKQDETMLTSPISRARLIEVLAQAIDRFCTEPRQRRVSGG